MRPEDALSLSEAESVDDIGLEVGLTDDYDGFAGVDGFDGVLEFLELNWLADWLAGSKVAGFVLIISDVVV